MQSVRDGELLAIAKPLKADPSCTDATKLFDAIPLLTSALGAKHYGDGLRVLSEYERRLLCLDVRSSDNVDILLAAYTLYAWYGTEHNAALEHSLLQLGLLAYDLNPPGRDSLWLAVLRKDPARLRAALSGYPEAELGLWAYDLESGHLGRYGALTAESVFDWLAKSEQARSKDCLVDELTKRATPSTATSPDTTELECDLPGGGDSTSGSSGSAGGLASVPGVSCIVEARASSGPRGQLNCVRASLGNPLSMQPTDMQGVPDKLCARSDSAGSGGGGSGGAAGSSGGGKSSTGGSGGTGGSSGTGGGSTGGSGGTGGANNGGSTTPTGPASGGTGSGSDGVVIVRKGSADAGTFYVPGSLLHKVTVPDGGSRDIVIHVVQSDGGIVWDKPDGGKPDAVKPFNSSRPVNGDDGPTDPCSGSSAAAARVRAAYRCLSPEAPPGAPPGSPGDPTIILTTEPTGQPSATMSCLQQGGDGVRQLSNDPRCAIARCMPGESCVCDRAGHTQAEAEAAIANQRAICRQTAYCVEGGDCPCDQIGAPRPASGTGSPPPNPGQSGLPPAPGQPPRPGQPGQPSGPGQPPLPAGPGRPGAPGG